MQPNTDPRINEPTVGKVLLKSRGFFVDDYWFWICIGALVAFSLLFNVLFIAALTFLNRKLLIFLLHILFESKKSSFDDIFLKTKFQLWVTQKMQSWMKKMAKIKIRHPLDSKALKVWAYMLSSKTFRGRISIFLLC